jgi:hypothetical protein
LVGSYEREVHPAVEQAFQHSTFVNIGAAEGYLAVGVAMRAPQVSVYAFETDSGGRKMMRDLAALNDCTVQILGQCDTKTLNNLRVGADLMLWVDVEGYERVLLDPERVPILRRATILVEQHPHVDPTTPAVLDERFAPTHYSKVYTFSPRRREEFPALKQLSDRDAALVLLERAGAQSWTLYLPRESASPADLRR